MLLSSFRRPRLVGTLVLATLVSGVLVAPAYAEPRPSARDVARSERDVRERAAAVGRVKGRLAHANADLEQLATQAEVAIERYHGEVVQLGQARRAYAEARARLAVAERRFAAARAELATFAADAYRANMSYGSWTSIVGADGGPQGFLDRVGMVQVMAQRQAGLLDRIRAAKIICDMYRRRAADAVQAQQAATGRATAAKRAAQAAVTRQRQAVEVIEAAKARLLRQLSAAEAKATKLRTKLRNTQIAAPVLKGHRRGITVANAALRWLGTPYSWGGGTAAGPSFGIAHGAGIKGFDCSGLSLYAWARVGVRLDHWTGTQWTSGPHVARGNLQPGDLLFFATNTSNPGTIHHVGIYIGRGQMVEAPYTGARVRISSAWRNDLIGATRPA